VFLDGVSSPFGSLSLCAHLYLPRAYLRGFFFWTLNVEREHGFRPPFSVIELQRGGLAGEGRRGAQYTVLAACVIVLSGCAADRPPIWDKPGSTEQEFNVDKFDCMRQTQENRVAIVGNLAASGTVTNAPLYNACMQARVWTSR
jgi:hypothetical protein